MGDASPDDATDDVWPVQPPSPPALEVTADPPPLVESALEMPEQRRGEEKEKEEEDLSPTRSEGSSDHEQPQSPSVAALKRRPARLSSTGASSPVLSRRETSSPTLSPEQYMEQQHQKEGAAVLFSSLQLRARNPRPTPTTRLDYLFDAPLPSPKSATSPDQADLAPSSQLLSGALVAGGVPLIDLPPLQNGSAAAPAEGETDGLNTIAWGASTESDEAPAVYNVPMRVGSVRGKRPWDILRGHLRQGTKPSAKAPLQNSLSDGSGSSTALSGTHTNGEADSIEPFSTEDWDQDSALSPETSNGDDLSSSSRERSTSMSSSSASNANIPVTASSSSSQYKSIKMLYKKMGANKSILDSSTFKKDEKKAAIRLVPASSISVQLPSSDLLLSETSAARWYEVLGVDASSLSHEEIKRQETIFELVETETDYIADLQMIQEVFIKEIQQRQLMTQRETFTVFSNLEQLIGINQELLKKLKERQRIGVVHKVGDIFMELASYLKMYTFYCANQPDALSTLQKLKENDQLQDFLKSCQQRKECRNLALTAFLLLPVQRICKYPLFLKTILKHTPETHEDHENMVSALSMVENVVESVNKGKRMMESQQKMIQISSMIDFAEPFMLMVPTRHYVYDAPLPKVEKSGKLSERHGFLFNDVLLWTKQNVLNRKRYQVKEIFMLTRCIIVDQPDLIGDDEAAKHHQRFTFEIVFAGRGRFKLGFSDVGAKQQWLRPLKNITDRYLEEQKEIYDKNQDAADNSEEDDSDDEAHPREREHSRSNRVRVVSIYSSSRAIDGLSLETYLPKKTLSSGAASLPTDDDSNSDTVSMRSITTSISQTDLHEHDQHKDNDGAPPPRGSTHIETVSQPQTPHTPPHLVLETDSSNISRKSRPVPPVPTASQRSQHVGSAPVLVTDDENPPQQQHPLQQQPEGPSFADKLSQVLSPPLATPPNSSPALPRKPSSDPRNVATASAPISGRLFSLPIAMLPGQKLPSAATAEDARASPSAPPPPPKKDIKQRGSIAGAVPASGLLIAQLAAEATTRHSHHHQRPASDALRPSATPPPPPPKSKKSHLSQEVAWKTVSDDNNGSAGTTPGQMLNATTILMETSSPSSVKLALKMSSMSTTITNDPPPVAVKPGAFLLPPLAPKPSPQRTSDTVPLDKLAVDKKLSGEIEAAAAAIAIKPHGIIDGLSDPPPPAIPTLPTQSAAVDASSQTKTVPPPAPPKPKAPPPPQQQPGTADAVLLSHTTVAAASPPPPVKPKRVPSASDTSMSPETLPVLPRPPVLSKPSAPPPKPTTAPPMILQESSMSPPKPTNGSPLPEGGLKDTRPPPPPKPKQKPMLPPKPVPLSTS